MGLALEKHEPDRLLRLREVMQRVPFGRSTIYARMHRGEFPKGRDLGGGIVAWLESDIQAWIDSRPVAHSNDDEQRVA